MELNNLLFKIENRIATITINRPEKLNALNHQTLTELDIVFDQLKTDKSVSVVIITGSGEKAFVAGADISELKKLNKESGKLFSEFGQSVFNKIENSEKPVLAAVNGFALGGGCELACACHIRFASLNAKFGQPEINLGIIPGYGGTQRLSRLINTGRALEYILTGDMISAEEAREIGLVNRVYPNSELIQNVVKFAEKILSKGTSAISASIKTINSNKYLSQKDGIALEAELFSDCCETDDFKEGTTAFLEKRKPNFKK